MMSGEISVRAGPPSLAAYQETRYSLLAAQTLVIYEWVACFNDEIALIHSHSWSSVKVAYIFCRYYPMLFWPVFSWAYVGNHPVELCERIARPLHALAMPLIVSAQAVLFMRAYAFSGRNKVVFCLLAACFGFVVGAFIWFYWVNVPILATKIVSVTSNMDLDPPEAGCFIDYGLRSVGKRIALAMLALLNMEFVSLTIVIICCIRRPSRQTPLGKYFLRQGLSAFAVTFILSIVGLMIYFRAGSTPYGGITLPFVFLVPDLVACRLILQLRRRVKPSESEMSREHSRLVRNALETRAPSRTRSFSGRSRLIATDVWAIESSGDP